MLKCKSIIIFFNLTNSLMISLKFSIILKDKKIITFIISILNLLKEKGAIFIKSYFILSDI